MSLDEIPDRVREIFSEYLEDDPADIENLSIEADFLGTDNPDALVEEDEKEVTIVLNLSNFNDSELDVFEKFLWDSGGFFNPEASEDINLTLNLLGDEELEEITDYVDEHLQDSDTAMIRNCLYIRKDWESPSHYTSKKELSDRRKELSNRFNDREIATLANLCSGGYYDPDGYMRKLFENSKEMSIFEDSEQQRIHNYVITKNPFAVFVSNKYGESGTKKEIEDKIEAYEDHPVRIEFVDARAQGGNNRDTVEQAILEIHKECDLLRYSVQVTERETAYRISPTEFIPIPDDRHN